MKKDTFKKLCLNSFLSTHNMNMCMHRHNKLRDIPYSQATDRKGREDRKVKNPWRQLRATAVIQTII